MGEYVNPAKIFGENVFNDTINNNEKGNEET